MEKQLPEKREKKYGFLFEKRLDTAYDYFKDKVFRRVFPEIGKIKIGKRVPYQKNGETILLPQREDRFIITKTIKGSDGNFLPDTELMETIAKKTNQDPNKLTRIPILFPFNTPRLNFQIWFVSYRDGMLYCRGDGKVAQRYEKGKIEIVECPCERLDYDERNPEKCRPYGRLNCLIRDAKYFGGVWVFRTRSLRSIETILRELEYMYYTMFKGVLSGVVFLLVLNREPVLVEGKLQYIYTVSLLYDPDEDYLEGTVYDKIRKRIQEEKESEDFKLRTEEEKKMLPLLVNQIIEEETSKIDEIKEEFFPGEEEQILANEINQKIHQVEEPVLITEPLDLEVEPESNKTIVEKVVEKEETKGETKEEAKKETKETKKAMANQGQVSIIKREFIKNLGLAENDEVLKNLYLLTFEDAAKILGMMRAKEYEKAYDYAKSVLFGKEDTKENATKDSTRDSMENNTKDSTNEIKQTTKKQEQEELPVITLDDLFEEEEDELL
ncbi:MAG: hypothetical protein ACP5HC_02140 [Caldisericum sp.]